MNQQYIFTNFEFLWMIHMVMHHSHSDLLSKRYTKTDPWNHMFYHI